MRLPIAASLACFAVLTLLGNLRAQEVTDRETMIHKNIKLAEMAVSTDIPANLASQYRQLLPLFRKVLTQNTKDQSDENRMLIRVEAGVKEVGSAKTKRALAHVTSSCRDSTREYIGSLILHSYLTNGPVNEEEIEEFLRKQILEPMECYVPTPRVFGAPKIEEEPVLVVAEIQPVAAGKPQPAPAPAVSEVLPTNQAQSGSEIEIHQNVRLIELKEPNEIPTEIMNEYREFLPMFNEVLQKNTKDQPEEKRMTIRVQAGMKEVGTARTKRGLAHVTLSCRNSTRQYVGDLILYSYLTRGPVNEEETEQFLRKQILEPSECYIPTKRVFSLPETD